MRKKSDEFPCINCPRCASLTDSQNTAAPERAYCIDDQRLSRCLCVFSDSASYLYVLHFLLISESLERVASASCICCRYSLYSTITYTLHSIPYTLTLSLSLFGVAGSRWLPQTNRGFLPIHYGTVLHCTALYTGAVLHCAANCTLLHCNCTFLPLYLPQHCGRYNTLQRATTYIRAFLPYRTVPLPYRDSRFLLNPNTWTLADIHPFPHQTRSSIAGTQVSANQTRYSPHCLHIPQKQLRLIGSYLDSEQNISRHTPKRKLLSEWPTLLISNPTRRRHPYSRTRMPWAMALRPRPITVESSASAHPLPTTMTMMMISPDARGGRLRSNSSPTSRVVTSLSRSARPES